MKPIEDLRTFTDNQLRTNVFNEGWVIAVFGSSPQDKEYCEIDKAEAAREAECRAKEKADQEAAAAAEAAEAEEEARRKQRGAEILTNPEPATGAEPTARIRLQLPSGERLQRNFRADQCLEEVYDWAHCCRPQAKPKRFELCISFPARTLTERSATLQELDLVPSAALVLREAES
ncbi:Ubxn2b [Symbiodinium sp. CCMP2592]|nr:Ubxn2b [Symbiodinium sp. CCMP2592]